MVKTQHDLDHFPYGWMLWPSAIGLSKYILSNPQRFAGKRVLELGCGVGMSGVAAAIAGGFTYRAVEGYASVVRTPVGAARGMAMGTTMGTTMGDPTEGKAVRHAYVQPGDVITILERRF